ncbi:hypothetical protein HOLDEFILI_03968, partial [Holdemania filiformis DSM 12042]
IRPPLDNPFCLWKIPDSCLTLSAGLSFQTRNLCLCFRTSRSFVIKLFLFFRYDKS